MQGEKGNAELNYTMSLLSLRTIIIICLHGKIYYIFLTNTFFAII